MRSNEGSCDCKCVRACVRACVLALARERERERETFCPPKVFVPHSPLLHHLLSPSSDRKDGLWSLSLPPSLFLPSSLCPSVSLAPSPAVPLCPALPPTCMYLNKRTDQLLQMICGLSLSLPPSLPLPFSILSPSLSRRERLMERTDRLLHHVTEFQVRRKARVPPARRRGGAAAPGVGGPELERGLPLGQNPGVPAGMRRECVRPISSIARARTLTVGGASENSHEATRPRGPSSPGTRTTARAPAGAVCQRPPAAPAARCTSAHIRAGALRNRRAHHCP